MSLIESALVVLVPEAEVVVKPFRDRYDPSAAVGVPAHITLLYPFKPPNEIDDGVLENLRHCFARFPPFRFTLAAISRFGMEVLYLVPEPDEPFRQLTLAIWGGYPEVPPYSGKWTSIIPHLTVAQLADERQLERVADQFAQASQTMLPFHATAAEVTLMDNQSGRWQTRSTFRLRT
jgi:2'-5' RNA ligase